MTPANSRKTIRSKPVAQKRFARMASARPTIRRRIPKEQLGWDTVGVPKMSDELPAFESELIEPDGVQRKPKDARDALVEVAFTGSTTSKARRKIKRGQGIAIVVSVPNAGWIRPVDKYLSELIEAESFTRDGTDRRKHLPSEGNDLVSEALTAGRNVVGISQAPDKLLPSLLVTCADIRVRLEQPDATTIARAMKLCLRGRVPSDLPPNLGAGLEFHELVAALRQGSSPRDAVRRLQSAANARLAVGQDDALPTLQDAVFYGEAREWGLALAQDVVDVRHGNVDWPQVARGAVFHGPTGTGKSWLVRILGRACDLPVIEASVADLFASSAGYLDSVIKAQRAVFARAAASRPCILFWDEIDALPNRATLSPRNRDWWMPVVDDFLVQVSTAAPGIIIIGATNLIENVDPALLRPGRLERKIEIKPPSTAEGLAMILRFHLGNELADADLVSVARLGLGATAAMAMDWVQRARRTARQSKHKMTSDDLVAVIAPPDRRSPELLRRSAIHEAAHAVAAIALGVQQVDHLSIVAHGDADGRMILVEPTEVGFESRETLENLVIVMLAGRAAECVFFGTPSAGAGGTPTSDLAIATRLIVASHASLGLGNSLLYRKSERQDDILFYDPKMRELVERQLQTLNAKAQSLIRDHRITIEKLSQALIARRYLLISS